MAGTSAGPRWWPAARASGCLGPAPPGLRLAGRRAGGSLARAAGLAMGRTSAGGLLRARPGEHSHAHDHGDRATAFSTHLVSDFLFMGKFIVLGAGLSALVQSAVPESTLSAVGGAPVLSSLSLMFVAFVLSL